jgi:hypothetical protein
VENGASFHHLYTITSLFSFITDGLEIMEEMNMKNRLVQVGIVFGIILLFICIGIQPVFAYVSENLLGVNEDDCEICPNIKRIKNLVLIKENKKLFNMINEQLVEISNQKNDKTKGNFRPVCKILLAWMNFSLEKLQFYEKIYEKIEWLIDILDIFSDLIIFRLFATFNFAQLLLPYILGVLLNCWEHPILLNKN